MTCCEHRSAPARPDADARTPRRTGCRPVRAALTAAFVWLLLQPEEAAAQAPAHRTFPATALRGELAITAPPEASLNGAPVRLAPGARIRAEDNLLRLPAALAGQRLLVHYTLEPTTGLVLDVWILNATERVREPWPATPEQARAWRFDPSAQTWTRR
jgi:hypothetical protein